MARIYICYRREDSKNAAGRISDWLKDSFGEKAVFFDVNDIPLGIDFHKDLKQNLKTCNVLLAVIDKNWLTTTDESGMRQLDTPDDYVRS